ncbi:heme exporter protein CcmD [Duganella sp. FT80W]|uniref:Heme exporter protein D n=1 Tax=Duganella guangzhouensis TaxID=2666084 RepID=A0A6I2LA54_9BURK|nr:heme exporter protein CcmD [Duganella guangzhouensis]MRW94888.1 heme exporter protein CcmD [Duganella guangzhouensis]
MSDWLHMGGYGLYVWGSIGVALLLPVAEAIALRLRRRAALEQLQHQQDQE